VLAPVRLYDAVPARALAVFAHPDDPEVACAGALARWTSAGASVELIVCNRGDKGTTDAGINPRDLAKARELEVVEAARELGLAAHHHLRYADGEITNDLALRRELVAHIRRLRPEVVIAPDPTAVFFGESYINHRDHREVGWAVLDSVAPAAGSPHYFPDAGPAHHVPAVLLSGTLEPDVWVDITGTIDAKVRAVTAHRTQVGDDPSLVAAVLHERAADAGRRAGVAMAEGYRLLHLTSAEPA
jgi:LmbE family N-acetylglucosaminyl deacetylase